MRGLVTLPPVLLGLLGFASVLAMPGTPGPAPGAAPAEDAPLPSVTVPRPDLAQEMAVDPTGANPGPAGVARSREFHGAAGVTDLASLTVEGAWSVIYVTGPGIPGDGARRELLRRLAEVRRGIYVSVVTADAGTAGRLGVASLPEARIHGPDRAERARGDAALETLRTLFAALPAPGGPFASRPPPAASESENPRFTRIESRGEVIETESMVVPGSYTVFVYSSRADTGEAVLLPYLERLAKYRRNAWVRWIDVDRPGMPGPDLESPLAKKLNLTRLPEVRLRSPEGKVLGIGDRALEILYEHLFQLPPGKGQPGDFRKLDPGGEVIEIDPLKQAGKMTSIVFCSDLLEQCRFFEPFIRRLAETRPEMNTRVVLVDAKGAAKPSFDSKLALHYDVQHLPDARLFGPDGRMFAGGDKALELLQGEFRYLPPPAEGTGPIPASEAVGPVVEITWGNRLVLADYAVRGKTTIFDFYSPFCGPCKQLQPVLEEIAARRSDIVVRTVNINRPGVWGIDGDSPVARQHNVISVPYFMVYGPDGNLVSAGNQAYRKILLLARELE